MKAMKRITKLLKDEGIKLSNYSSVESVPIGIKMAIIEDLLRHIDDNGTKYPSYNSLNLRAHVQGLIQAYAEDMLHAPGGWLKFIKLSDKLANLILREYIKTEKE